MFSLERADGWEERGKKKKITPSRRVLREVRGPSLAKGWRERGGGRGGCLRCRLKRCMGGFLSALGGRSFSGRGDMHHLKWDLRLFSRVGF